MSNDKSRTGTPAGNRLLIVEPSSTMRYVLDNYLQELGYETLALDDYRDAHAELRRQFDSFQQDEEFSCVLLGWQSSRNAEAARFLSQLDSLDFQDLPAIVLSQETRADSRAWVAGRSQTTLLRWKDYKGVKERLSSLLDRTLESDAENSTIKFTNDDIRILVVDDSASIRFALRDLLELHGYQVTVVSSHSEAMTAAKLQRFDIAVLDYYLQESTGDDLCRELIDEPATGEITCAILTGTYSDHIIKSSLRAGAVECMFKNESGELLLARIDAISRMVRQQKTLLVNQKRLDAVIDQLGGPTMVIDHDNRIEFASESARRLLGYLQNQSQAGDSSESLSGHRVGEVVNADLPGQIENCRRGDVVDDKAAMFRGADGQPVPVLYSCVELASNPAPEDRVANSCLIVFQERAMANSPTQSSSDFMARSAFSDDLDAPSAAATSNGIRKTAAVGQGAAAVAAITSTAANGVQAEGLGAADIPLLTEKMPAHRQANGAASDREVENPSDQSASSSDFDAVPEARKAGQETVNTAQAFTTCLSELLTQVELRRAGGLDTSLLLVEFAFLDGQQLKPVTAEPERLRAFDRALRQAYPAAGQVAYFGSSRFGMMLRHQDVALALMQCRKLMQACNQLASDLGLEHASSMGALTNLDLHANNLPDDVLAHLHRNLSKIAQHSRNKILLVDHDKMLNVYREAAVAG